MFQCVFPNEDVRSCNRGQLLKPGNFTLPLSHHFIVLIQTLTSCTKIGFMAVFSCVASSPRLHLIVNCIVSLVSFKLEQNFSLSLSFSLLTFLKKRVVFVKCSTTWVCWDVVIPFLTATSRPHHSLSSAVRSGLTLPYCFIVLIQSLTNCIKNCGFVFLECNFPLAWKLPSTFVTVAGCWLQILLVFISLKYLSLFPLPLEELGIQFWFDRTFPHT